MVFECFLNLLFYNQFSFVSEQIFIFILNLACLGEALKNLYQIKNLSEYWKTLFLRSGVVQKIKRSSFKKPTLIQEKVIPKVLQEKNLVVVSPTASGKTLSYLLPIYQMVQYGHKKVLILVPTKELVFQIRQMIQQIDKEFALKCLAIFGGVPLSKSKQTVQKPWSILVSTPGRLRELSKGMPFLLNEIRICVYDEFDKLLQVDFEEDISFLYKKMDRKTQYLYFSATQAIQNNSLLSKPYEKITIQQQNYKIYEELYFIMNVKKKMTICLDLLQQFFNSSQAKKLMNGKFSQALVFVNNRKKAEHLYGLLKQHYSNCEFIHSQVTQRDQKFQDIMSGKIPLIITTDLMGRGVDTLQVNLVINFDLPRSEKEYLHHKGRVGRLGRHGEYYSLLDTSQYMEYIKIEKNTPYPIPSNLLYSNKHKWFLTAKAKHSNFVSKQKRIENINYIQDQD